METFTTRTEAINALIIEPIEAGEATAEEFDIDAIANEVIGDWHQGYRCLVTPGHFWQIVEKHAI